MDFICLVVLSSLLSHLSNPPIHPLTSSSCPHCLSMCHAVASARRNSVIDPAFIPPLSALHWLQHDHDNDHRFYYTVHYIDRLEIERPCPPLPPPPFPAISQDGPSHCFSYAFFLFLSQAEDGAGRQNPGLSHSDLHLHLKDENNLIIKECDG